jgi:hypothetical protein
LIVLALLAEVGGGWANFGPSLLSQEALRGWSVLSSSFPKKYSFDVFSRGAFSKEDLHVKDVSFRLSTKHHETAEQNQNSHGMSDDGNDVVRASRYSSCLSFQT